MQEAEIARLGKNAQLPKSFERKEHQVWKSSMMFIMSWMLKSDFGNSEN
jgi:hypothetical protein